ncbi:hypothetical protein OAV24_02440 [Gammaproteobacteria bacterium]|nr:hypothetical protein [Gammaproteobacteria bacterium]
MKTSGWTDKWLFIIILLMGVAGMFILWNLKVAQGFVTVWPVLCLLGYATFLGATKRYQIREDRAGDNLYYLGFLYTLVSLGHALWAFTYSEDGSSGSAQIITDFGIALATTIVGLALRVIFNQLREDPIEAERSARLELNKAVQDVVNEMSRMRVSVSGYTKQIEQSIEEIHIESRKSIEENIRNTTETYQRTIANVGEQIKESASSLTASTQLLTESMGSTSNALAGLNQRVEEFKLSPDLFENVLKDAVSPLAESAQEFRGKLQNIRFDPEMIERAITRPFEQYSEALDQLRQQQAQQTHMISNLADTIDGASKGTQEISDALQEVGRLKIPDDAISNAIEPAYREMQQYIGSLREQSAADQTRLQSISETVAGFAGQISNLQNAFDSVIGVGDAITSMHSGFTETAQSIRNTTSEIANVIDQHKNVVSSLDINTQETAEKLQQYRDQVDRELELVHKANQQVFSQLAQLAETIVTRLDSKI